MFERDDYKERMGMMACEVPDDDSNSTSTCNSILSTGTRTNNNINGEASDNNVEFSTFTEMDCLDNLQQDLPVPINESNNIDDNISIETRILIDSIRVYNTNKVETINEHIILDKEGAHTGNEMTEMDHDMTDLDDCSECTTDLINSIRNSAVSTSRNVATTTGTNHYYHNNSETFQETFSESSVVGVLTGMKNDVRVEEVFDKMTK